jgi:hypothetical protein
MRLKCKLCGREVKGAQGAIPHLRRGHGIAIDAKLVNHRDKFEVLPDLPKPLSNALVKAEPLVKVNVVNDDDTITIVPNMVVVTDGRGRIGILEWYDRSES